MIELAILPLGAIEDAELIGGKARVLSQLIREGFIVPPGFVVTTAVFGSMDAELRTAILDDFDLLGAKMVAVRSSAAAEDGKAAAWAGQMDTFLKVKRKDLIISVERCWASANSPRALAYAKQKSIKAGPVAVIVQRMVHGSTSGVAFSVHPITQDKNQLIIEAVPGLAESLVSGSATPDSYVINKKLGNVIREELQHRHPLLSELHIKELNRVVCKMEKFFGTPIDVEWTILKDKLFILQSRPITTLG